MRSVGILANRGTLISGFYQRALASAGFDVLVPSEREQGELIPKAIASVKVGAIGEAYPAASGALAGLIKRGVSAVVLASAELPVAFGGISAGMLVLDANLSLTRVCVRASLRMADEELLEISMRPRCWA